MATEADVLRSINLILQSQERREQFAVETTLNMMEFAQRKRAQDVSIASQTLQLAQASIKQAEHNLAADFLAASNLGQFYEPGTNEEDKATKISEQANRLMSGEDGLPMFDQSTAERIVTAIWSYRESQDPRGLTMIAKDLGYAVEEVSKFDPSWTVKDLSPIQMQQAKLIESYGRLKPSKDLEGVTKLAINVSRNEKLIMKETMEFLKGDYEIQSDIGLYEDIDIPKPGEPTDFLTTSQGMSILEELIDASKKDEDWSPGVKTTLAVIGGATAYRTAAPAIRKEAASWSTGYNDYLKQVAKDAKRYNPSLPQKGGMTSNAFKTKYGVIKGNFLDSQKKAMRVIHRLAKKSAWGYVRTEGTTGISRSLAALEKIHETKWLGKLTKYTKGGKPMGFGGWIAPMAGRAIGKGIAGEPGEAVGQTLGAGYMVKKVGLPSIKTLVGTSTKPGFWKYLLMKLPKNVAKKLAVPAGAAIAEPTFFGEIAVAVFAVGLSAYELYNIYNEWSDL